MTQSLREFHGVSFRAKLDNFISVSGQFLITVYMKYPEMKLTAGVISLQSFWQKCNFLSSDKISCKHYPKWNHMKGNICACVYFIKRKMIGFYWTGRFSGTTTETKFLFISPQWIVMWQLKNCIMKIFMNGK